MHAALTVACLCLGDAFQGPPRLAPRRALRADGRNAAVAAVEAERRPLAARARTLFRFTRPHTFVGTAVAVPALHAYAAASAAALLSRACARSVASALAPALLMNVFITGLNQLCDVDIDRVNKPHLPVASGELSVHHARLVVGACLVAALALGRRSSAPVQRVLAGSAALVAGRMGQPRACIALPEPEVPAPEQRVLLQGGPLQQPVAVPLDDALGSEPLRRIGREERPRRL